MGQPVTLAPRTKCLSCGEELWGPSEGKGLCSPCRRSREEMDLDAADSGADAEGNDDA